MPKRNGPGNMKNPQARLDASVTIGAYLRDKRLGRNVSLEEVSAATGITSPVLQALENEEREKLPAEVYIKAFYKKYAEYLGLDSAEIQAKYQQQAGVMKKPRSRAHLSTVITLKGQEENIFGEILRRLFLPLAILGLGVLLYWLYKNYLSPFNPLGIYREYYPSVCPFLPANPADFFC